MAAVIPGSSNDDRAGLACELRRGDAASLAAALTRGRVQLLALFDGFERALGPQGLHIAHDPVLNLPLWELGHIGWFEEFWLTRLAGRDRGVACDPLGPRADSLLPQADGWYDSSNVAHGSRWQLALPDPAATRRYLAAVRQRSLASLARAGTDDDALYFYRLVLFHEDMHREAWHAIAQRLGIDLGPGMTGRAPRPSIAEGEWPVSAALLQPVSSGRGTGFAFDNELGAEPVPVAGFCIDRAPVSWARFMPFIDAGGYDEARWWSADGWQWRQREVADQQRHPRHPRHLRRSASDRDSDSDSDSGWERLAFGAWAPLDLAAPAVHLTAFEAEAWCRWAGRRLPTEAEWELAATTAPRLREAFDWGEVWEWTASPFVAYAGFTPHPYRDYSQPWFDGRPVLRGGSFATAAHMKHPRYRNFFQPDRGDVFAGFRSCSTDT